MSLRMQDRSLSCVRIRLLRGRCSASPRGNPLSLSSRRQGRRSRIRHRGISPKVRMVRRKLWIRGRSRGLTGSGRAGSWRARSCLRFTSARLLVRARGQSAIRELPALARTGITVLEVMPVADFTGEFGWGYDGVDWYRAVAPVRHARRHAAVRRCGARVGSGGDSGRRLQPLRAGRELH